MGVVNVTPNSFFDGGLYASPDEARRRVDEVLRAGAAIVDIGAESTKPGSPEVPAAEQIARLGPALDHAVAMGAFVSIDTMSPGVAAACLGRGAQMVNDVSCLRDPDLAIVAAEHRAFLVITHSRVPMSLMTGFSEWPDDDYTDIVGDVSMDWGRAAETAMRAGVKKDKLIFDPGIGFAKNARHSLELLARLGEFSSLDVPIASGPSRKSFITRVDPSSAAERLGGTLAACLISARNGADLLRVHDVAEVRQALAVSAAIDAHARPPAAAGG
jgi:dihydropteroate synthase